MTDRAVQVHRRHVFYIPGFDPVAPRKYRELYRAEAELQAGISGYQISVEAANRQAGNYAWSVSTHIDGQQTETLVEVLDWSDLVRKAMGQSTPRAIWIMLSTLWFGFASGAVRAWYRARPQIIIATLYPYAALLAQLVLGLWLGAALGGGVARLFGQPGWAGAVPGALALTLGGMVWLRRYDLRTMIYYLLFIGAFGITRGRSKPNVYKEREQQFAHRIAEVMSAGEVDEVLVVAHSAGTCLSIPVVAEALRRAPNQKLSLLTLAQVIPYESFHAGARQMRSDLNFMALHPHLDWLDVSAPSDGACFALCDPVAQSGVAPPAQRNPKVVSAAFSQTLSRKQRNSPRHSYFRRHFQYLYAFDQPRHYDYFQITAGPVTLAARYADIQPSKQMRNSIASRHTDRAP
ncbi:hypothetical protein [Halovulum sp. GXIMD14793]